MRPNGGGAQAGEPADERDGDSDPDRGGDEVRNGEPAICVRWLIVDSPPRFCQFVFVTKLAAVLKASAEGTPSTPVGFSGSHPLHPLQHVEAHSNGGNKLLAGTGDGRVFVWNSASGLQDGPAIRAHGTNDVWELVMHPDGDRFVTGGTDGATKVWSLSTRRQVASPFVTDDGVRMDTRVTRVEGLVWSDDGSTLIAGGEDGRVREWDMAGSRQIEITEVGHLDRIEDAAASSDRSVLVTLGRDQDVRIWDLSARHPVTTTVAMLDAPQWGLAASPVGRRVAVGSDDGIVNVYDLATKDRVARLAGASGRVLALAFVDADRVVAGDERGSLLLWDLSSNGDPITRRSAHADPITSVAVSRDGRTIASADGRGIVRVWRAEDLDPIAATKEGQRGVNDLTFTPSGEIVAAGNDGTVAFWTENASVARDALVVDREGDSVRSTAVSPDGKLLVVALANGVKLWDLTTGDQRAPLNGQPAAPLDVEFSPDGEWIASTSNDGTVALWDSGTGEDLGTRFSYHDEAVWHAAITADSAFVTASVDGSVRSLDVLDWKLACKLGAGALDRRNRENYLGGARPVGCRG